MFNSRWLRLRSATTTEKQPTVQQYPKIKSKKVASAPLSHHYRKINYIQQYPKITSKKSGFGFAQPPLQNNKLHPTIPKKQIAKPGGFGFAQPLLQKNNTQPNNTQKANQKKGD
jgi:hypothetical protein